MELQKLIGEIYIIIQTSPYVSKMNKTIANVNKDLSLHQ